MKAFELTARQIARLVLAPLTPARKGVDAMRRCHLIILLAVLGLAVQARGQEPIFISNFTGGEVLSVNQNTGAATVIYNPGGGFLPEGIRMGPDGKLYVCAPDNNKIIRLTLNSEVVTGETVYDQSVTGGPTGPEGPSFNSNGDLYFNTRGAPETHTGVWKITATQLSGTLPATPVNVVTAAQTGSTWGEGTAFDHNDNLLFVDRSGGNVWRFNTSTSTLVTPAIITGLGTPIGIAVSPSGDIFVADTGTTETIPPEVQHFDPNGTFIETYASDFDELSGETNDVPIYLAFDASGNLFVTTARALDATVGSVWEVTSSTSKTNLTNPANSEGLPYALGIALGPTSAPSQPATLFSSGGSFNLGWPVGCVQPNGSTANCSYTFGIKYPKGMFQDGSTATVTPKETTQADWALRTPVGNAYHGTSIAPVAGEGGYGFIFSADCVNISSTCASPNSSTLSYDIATTWKSSQANYCGSGPGLLSAEPIGSKNWVNTLINCTQISSDPTYGSGGTKKCPSGTKCLSDWANVFNIGGPIASASPFSVDFGNVPLFGLRIQSITLTNIGNSPASISSVKVAPGDSDDFFALSLCFEPLDPQESCTIFVAFFADFEQVPPHPQSQSATLTIIDTANGSPHLIPLTATVVKRK
jgi:sugar lactone lactonase YvrE